MKARKRSHCCLCGELVLVGMRIGQISTGEGRGGWAHITCITGRRAKVPAGQQAAGRTAA